MVKELVRIDKQTLQEYIMTVLDKNTNLQKDQLVEKVIQLGKNRKGSFITPMQFLPGKFELTNEDLTLLQEILLELVAGNIVIYSEQDGYLIISK